MRDWRPSFCRTCPPRKSQCGCVRPIVARAGEHQGARLRPLAEGHGDRRWSPQTQCHRLPASLGLAETLLRALDRERFVQPTPIQASAVPPLLQGRDLLGVAQTGTGKTAAFALPMLHHLAASPAQPRRFATRALISPTRELALQIESHLHRLGSEQKRRVVSILGGMSQLCAGAADASRCRHRRRHTRRICDLMATGELKLNEVRYFVFDEADRMLDLGFIRDIRRIVAALLENRQSALFSATMPSEVGKLAETLLRNPVRVEIARSTSGDLPIEQRVHFVDPSAKRALLGRLLADPAMSRVIVFTRTKRSADRAAETLDNGGVRVSAIHGNKSQPARQKALEQFRSGRACPGGNRHRRSWHRCDRLPPRHQLRSAATARGLRPSHAALRAGASGVAISFCDAAEHGTLRAIERMTGVTIDIASGAPPVAQANRTAPKATTAHRAPHWREGARRRTGYRPADPIGLHADRSMISPALNSCWTGRTPMLGRRNDNADDVAYPSSIGFVLVHLGCFAAF